MFRRLEVCGYKVVGDFDKSEITLCELRFYVARILTKVLGATSEGQNLEGAQESPLSSPGVLGRLPKSGTPFSLQFLLLWLFSPSCLQRM